MHEIYCSQDPQVVPHKVPLVDLDLPGEVNQPPLGLAGQRLDQPDLGDRVVLDYTLDRGSRDIPDSGETKRSVSRTSRPRSHTWRSLKVPDWILGGWGHS